MIHRHQLIKAGIMDPATIVRSYSLSPGTPKKRVKILRDAFMATMRDPEFLAEAKKSDLDLNPLPGHEVEGIVQGFFKLQPRFILHDPPRVYSKACVYGNFIFLAGEDCNLDNLSRTRSSSPPALSPEVFLWRQCPR